MTNSVLFLKAMQIGANTVLSKLSLPWNFMETNYSCECLLRSMYGEIW